jgi:hypothetical protein
MSKYIGTKAVNLSTTSADVTGNADIDGNLTVGGNLTVSGTTITVDHATAQTVDLGDNDKIRLGADYELQLWSDGTTGQISGDVTHTGSFTTTSDLGINTANGNFYTAPRTWLTIVGDDSGPNSAANGTTNGAIQIQNVTNDVAMEIGISSPSNDRYSWIQTTNTQNHSTAYHMSLQPLGGFVGIGESQPDRPLHVKRTDSTGTVVKIEQSGAAGNATIEFADTNTTDTISLGSVGNDLVLKSDDGGIKLSSTSDPATTSLYAARGGNILLGGTSQPNWATDRIVLGKAGEQTNLQFGDAYLNMAVNQYYDGTGNKYIEAGVANRISMSSGGFYFQVAGSGSANGTLSFDNALHINNNGESVFYSSAYVPVEIQRDAGAATSGDYTALLLKTITSGTPSNQLGANMRFDVDGTLKGGITANAGGNLFIETSGTTSGVLYDVARFNASSLCVAGENGTISNQYGNSTRTNLQVDGSSEAIITLSHAGTVKGYINTNPASNQMDISANLGGFRFLTSAGASKKVEIDTNGNIVFPNGQGINFGASSGSNSSSAILDDYEEGTWTPTLTGATSNPTVSYGNRKGYYTKIGNQVTAHCFVSGSFSGGSGGVRVYGLPYTSSSSTNFTSAVWWEPLNVGDTGRQIMLYLQSSATNVILYKLESNGTAQDAQVQWSEVNGIEIRFSFTYIV